MSSVNYYENVNISNFNYSKPEKINNSYFGRVNYGKNEEPIYIQTPKLRCNSDVKECLNSKTPYLDLSISKKNINFYELFTNIDSNIIKKTFDNSENWFSKQLPYEIIDDMYKPITSPLKKDSEPTIKFKIPFSKNKVQCTCYNQNKESIDITNIKENDNLILVLHIKGIKILKQSFYCECYISQIKKIEDKNSKYNILNEYSFIDTEQEENEDDLDIFDEEYLNEIKERNNKIDMLKKEISECEINLSTKKKLLTELEIIN